MKVVSCEKLTAEVARTWDICSEQARLAAPVLAVLPKKFRDFAAAVELMREGYRSGQLTYSIIVAQKV